MKITMSSLEAKRIADAYLQRNTPYEEVKFVDVRNSDCTYKFLYSVADTFGRWWISILRLILSSMTSRPKL